ncbi:acyl-CoA dehydrogenase family protein [Staphylococcus xylosus]|uniref:acyl-CoA dehydrogenase family protein n=1 Tax=Staphylococcus xylosus TaxID=1288 RepID=UPI003F554035
MRIIQDDLLTALENTFIETFRKYYLPPIKNIGEYNNQKSNTLEETSVFEELKKLGLPFYTIPIKNDGYEFDEYIINSILSVLGKFNYQHYAFKFWESIECMKLLNDDSIKKNELSRIINQLSGIEIIGLHSNIPYSFNAKTQLYTLENISIYSHNYEHVHSIYLYINEGLFELCINEHNMKITKKKTIHNRDIWEINIAYLKLSPSNKLKFSNKNKLYVLSQTRIRQASYLLGLTQASLNEAIEYTNSRVQFNSKLINNKFISLEMAKMFTELEFVELKIFEVFKLKNNFDYYISATECLALISEISREISEKCLHFHGAFGTTNLSYISQLYKSIAYESIKYGSSDKLYEDILKTKGYEI